MQSSLALSRPFRPGFVSHIQVAAIPVRVAESGLEILLVTTRGQGRWRAPKGWARTETPNATCAMREAFEEAGVRGVADPYSLGEFEYEKGARRVPYRAAAFLMHVTEIASVWPEQSERRRAWFPVQVAARFVNNAALAALIFEAARRTTLQANGNRGNTVNF